MSSVVLLSCFQPVRYSSLVPVSAVTAASSVPSSLRASLLFPIAHSFTLLHDTLDCGTDAKSKLKFGVVVATIEQQVFICDGETAYRGMAARQSNRCWTGELHELFGPMSQCASHAIGDVDVWFLFLCLAIRRMMFRRS